VSNSATHRIRTGWRAGMAYRRFLTGDICGGVVSLLAVWRRGPDWRTFNDVLDIMHLMSRRTRLPAVWGRSPVDVYLSTVLAGTPAPTRRAVASIGDPRSVAWGFLLAVAGGDPTAGYRSLHELFPLLRSHAGAIYFRLVLIEFGLFVGGAYADEQRSYATGDLTVERILHQIALDEAAMLTEHRSIQWDHPE
jgi:hypothetical protein